jgi:hypothetical protein
VKRHRRRDTDIFSLSFLDCICCGFGAIILLLTLVRMGEPQAIEQARGPEEGRIARRGSTRSGRDDAAVARAVGKRQQLSGERAWRAGR